MFVSVMVHCPFVILCVCVCSALMSHPHKEICFTNSVINNNNEHLIASDNNLKKNHSTLDVRSAVWHVEWENREEE